MGKLSRIPASPAFANPAYKEEEVDPLPGYMVVKLCGEYVRSMCRSHKQRVLDWERSMEKVHYHEDLEAFGVHEETEEEKRNEEEKTNEEGDEDDGKSKSTFLTRSTVVAKNIRLPQVKPRVVYKDLVELEAVVRDNLQLWQTGGFKCEKANRTRLMKRPFKSWVRFIECAWLQTGPDDSDESGKVTPQSREAPDEK